MNNDKLRQAGEKFREAAGLMCEWLSDQFEAITDVFNNMAKAGTSANDALDALLTAHRAAGSGKLRKEKAITGLRCMDIQ